MAGQQVTQGQLPRRLGLWSVTALAVGMTVGSGIFRTPAEVAAVTGSVGAIIAVWVAGGLITACLALCISELATMFPQAGGLYVYIREAFGPMAAFVFGWTFLLINPASWAAIALIFAEYLVPFLHLPRSAAPAVASAAILTVCAINYVSVHYADITQRLLTPAKGLALIAIALLIFTLGDGSHGALATPLAHSAPTLGAFGVALAAVLWPFEGVASASSIAGETRDPGRTLPRALVMSVLIVLALYLAVNLAFLYVLPVPAIAGSGMVASDAMRAVAGSRGAAFIGGCAVLATFGALMGSAMSDPRIFFAMARDKMFFQRLGAVHPRFATPHLAVALSGGLAMIYVWVRSFEELATGFVLGMWFFYAVAAAGLIWMRRSRPAHPRPYKVFLYPVVPLAFILATGVLIANAVTSTPWLVATNILTTLAGIPVYFIWKRLMDWGPRRAAAEG